MGHRSRYTKKTQIMLAMEAEYGVPIETLLVDALNQHGTLERVAELLYVSKDTVSGWCKFLNIVPTKVWVVQK